jgi:cell division protein FtsL
MSKRTPHKAPNERVMKIMSKLEPVIFTIEIVFIIFICIATIYVLVDGILALQNFIN